MEKKYNVDSFNLDHTKVTAPFVRLAARKVGKKGDVVSKYDIRFTQPNKEFMPTGFYFTIWGELTEEEVANHLMNVLKKVAVWDKAIPATTEQECGNYRDHDLEGAKKYAKQWCDGIEKKGWNAFLDK